MTDPRIDRAHSLQPTVPGYMKPGAHFQVSIDNTPAGNDLATLIGAALSTIFPDGVGKQARLPTGVFIFPENGDLRFRDDGVNPAAAIIGAAGIGYPIPTKTEYLYTGDLDVIVIVSAGAGPVLTSLYFVY